MKKLRYGIIGYGAEGSFYSRELMGISAWGGSANPIPTWCTLGAICDIDPEKEAQAKKDFPDTPFFKDWKEMVHSGAVDAVITTVPHYLHPEIAIYCLEHNMHVMIEKPAGVDAYSVSKMNAAADAHPEVAFGIMLNQRTRPVYQKVKQIIDSGEMGNIRRSIIVINSWWRPDSYYGQSDWRATWGGEGGGILVNQAPHQLDLWQWICGAPTHVYAKCIIGAYRNIGVENDVTAMTRYANGATGVFVSCTHDPDGTDTFEIDLDGGKIFIEGGNKVTIHRLNKPEPEMNESMTMMDVYRLVARQSTGADGMYTEEVYEAQNDDIQHYTILEDFARHVVEGTPLFADGRVGLMGVRLANAMHLSSWLNKEVELPVDEKVYLEELNKRIAAEGKFPQRPL